MSIMFRISREIDSDGVWPFVLLGLYHGVVYD